MANHKSALKRIRANEAKRLSPLSFPEGLFPALPMPVLQVKESDLSPQLITGMTGARLMLLGVAMKRSVKNRKAADSGPLPIVT